MKFVKCDEKDANRCAGKASTVIYATISQVIIQFNEKLSTVNTRKFPLYSMDGTIFPFDYLPKKEN